MDPALEVEEAEGGSTRDQFGRVSTTIRPIANNSGRNSDLSLAFTFSDSHANTSPSKVPLRRLQAPVSVFESRMGAVHSRSRYRVHVQSD